MSLARRQVTLNVGISLALVIVAVFVTRGVWLDILHIAQRSEEQSHILLALPVALWLAWLRRHRLRRCTPTWSWLGPLAIAVGWVMAAVGFQKGIDLARHAGALVMVVGALLTAIGPNVALKFIPALVALVFLFPVPGRVRAPVAAQLQETSAAIAHYAMDLFGVPVIRSGNIIIINEVEVLVAEACNGMRMVSALALVTFAFVFSVPMRQGTRLFILAISPAVALVVNVVRLIPTVLIYGYGTESSAKLFHDVSGWLSLVVALGVLYLILKLLRWLEVPVAPYQLQEA